MLLDRVLVTNAQTEGTVLPAWLAPELDTPCFPPALRHALDLVHNPPTVTLDSTALKELGGFLASP